MFSYTAMVLGVILLSETVQKNSNTSTALTQQCYDVY